MKKITFFLLLFIPGLLLSQKEFVLVKGTISDNLHKVIPFATVQGVGTTNGTNADAEGHYYLRTRVPVKLQASFVGYKSMQKKVVSQKGQDTIDVDFVLTIDSAQLGQVEITGSRQAELIKESESLIDFDMADGHLLLLNKHSHGDQVVMYDTGMRELTRIQLRHHTEKLLRNQFDVYVIHGDSVYFLHYSPMSKVFEPFILTENYYNSFEPVKAYNAPYYYYGKTLGANAGVTYWVFNPRKDTQKILYSYFDENMQEKNEEAYQDMIGLQSQIHSVSYVKGIALRGFIRGDAASMGNIHSQINVVNDSVYVFNFNTDTFNVYDASNNLVRKIPMGFDSKKFAINKKEIITDDSKKECYFMYDMKGKTYLQKIDLATGRGLNTQEIKYPFIEKLRVSEGYAYYTCSDGGGNEEFLRHLYKQRVQ